MLSYRKESEPFAFVQPSAGIRTRSQRLGIEFKIAALCHVGLLAEVVFSRTALLKMTFGTSRPNWGKHIKPLPRYSVLFIFRITGVSLLE